MTQLRPYTDNFATSMAQSVHLLNDDVADLIAYIHVNFPQWRPEVRDLIQVHVGRDSRNGWDTWVVKLRSHPVGWTDGPIAGIVRLDIVGGRVAVRT